MARLWIYYEVHVVDFAIFLIGVCVGLVVGYPFGLFIDYLDKKEKQKNV